MLLLELLGEEDPVAVGASTGASGTKTKDTVCADASSPLDPIVLEGDGVAPDEEAVELGAPIVDELLKFSSAVSSKSSSGDTSVTLASDVS